MNENQNEEIISSENDDSEDQNTENTENLENEETSETVEVKEATSKDLTEKNKRLFARAKKAEEELKKLKSQKSQTPKFVSFNEEDFLKKVDERLEEKELNSLNLDEELKKEIKSYAKLNNVSIGKAKESDYIKFKLDKLEQIKKAEEASAGGDTRKRTEINFDDMDISKIDVWTEEGRKQWEEYKNHQKKSA